VIPAVIKNDRWYSLFCAPPPANPARDTGTCAGNVEWKEGKMPHVIVKLQAGRSGQQKAEIADLVTRAVMAGANCAEQSVSVSIEDIEPQDWVEKVFKPDIIAKPDTLYKKPGYNPL
jgi:4-oxalocrotonate tautomerase